MEWEDVPDAVDEWTAKAAGPARDLRREAVPTAGDVGYYVDPGSGSVALHARGCDRADLSLAKAAACRAVGRDLVRPLFLTHRELADPDAAWVKVAYSRGLRRLGEVLNFLPGQYAGGIPNFPSPLAATLTTGALGAGLGWGAGRLAQGFMPEDTGDHLPRTGAALGGLLGALPGAALGAAYAQNGHPVYKAGPLGVEAGSDPSPDVHAPWARGVQGPLFEVAASDLRAGLAGDEDSAVLPAADAAAAAFVKRAFGTLGWSPMARQRTLGDVDIDALGRTLWETGASPSLAATTMGAVYAARQLPDPYSRPGVVTGRQLGQLAMNAAGDYTKGLLAGAALNAVVGTPYSAPVFGAGAAALGVIGAVVPKLLGH